MKIFRFKLGLLLVLAFVLSMAVQAQEKTDSWLMDLLKSQASPLLKRVLARSDSFQYQIIYTRIERDKHNKPHFKNYYVHVNRDQYFNPASTVKLPTALVALEKINDMKVAGVNKYTPMLTDSSYSGQSKVLTDTSSEGGLPSIAQYIRKIFLVSDNDAYNRLYEFVGQQTLNEKLRSKGYNDVRITRRFVPMNEDENRHTNAIRFMQNGQTIYEQPPAYSNISFDFSKTILVGKGHWDSRDSLINEPMDFTKHNNLPLEDLQHMLQSALFPESVPKSQRFHLTRDDEHLLYQYMSAYPSESVKPGYDTSEYFNSYAKFFYKAGHQRVPAFIRIFNKPGWSFGYLTDAGYVADFKNRIEFMLSAVIYVNADGILNDDKYEYEEIGYPFFSEVYNIIYQFDLHRKRKYYPDLSTFNLRNGH
jgi:hypothetical protein